jgi:phosphate transport system permease protein
MTYVMKNPGLYRRRRIFDRLLLGLAVVAAGFGLSWLGFILYALISQGLSGISLKLFTELTPPPGEDGGLSNAIIGSVIMSSLAVAAGTPLGVLAGTYLAEYGRYGRTAFVVRFVNDILLSAPSIVTGLFIYALLVLRMGHFSGWAGAASLMIIVIPVVVRTTENMLLLVPNGLRDAARAGIVTGVLLAIARVSGETAPLLLTALGNSGPSTDLNAPMASLPVVIFNFAMSPYEDWHRLAWEGALLITATVLTLSILARILETSSKRSN